MVKASNFIRLGQWNVNEKVKRKKGKEKWKNKQKKNSNNRQSTVNLLNSGFLYSLSWYEQVHVPNTSERTANTTKRGQIWVKKRYRIRRSTKFPYLEENLWFKPMNFSLFRGPVVPSFLLVSRIILLIPTEHWISDFTTLKISSVYVFRFQFQGGFHDFISSMWYFHHVFLRVTNCSNQNFQEDDEK